MTENRVFIADPSLKDRRGHHFALTDAITRSVESQRWNAFWLSSFDAPETLSSDPSRVFRAFKSSLYDSYSTTGSTPSFFVRLLGWARIQNGKNRGKLPDRFDVLAKDIENGLKAAHLKFRFTPDDHLLFHTADGSTYRAAASFMSELPSEDCPTMHLCTPYDPVGVMPNRRNSEEVQTAIDVLTGLKSVHKTVFLYAENSLLAKHLSALWNQDVHPLPLPGRSFSPKSVDEANAVREQYKIGKSDFLVTCLGAARLEKGFHLMPDIIRRTIEMQRLADRDIKFLLHASPQIIGRHPVIIQAIEKLEAFPGDTVQLLLSPLTDAEYDALLLAADAVLLPYQENEYRVRGSGVVAEAIAAQKFIVAMSNTYPGHVAEQFHGGTGATPEELAKSLVAIVNGGAEREAMMRSEAEAYNRLNSISAYCNNLCLNSHNNR